MDIDDIRLRLANARRSCADAQSSQHQLELSREQVAKLVEVLARLEEAAEWLLSERDAFTGRLARRSALTQTDAPKITILPDSDPCPITPSPAPDG
jgi:hypothetical protein